MATDGTELLKKSCAQANSYPANLVCKNVPSQVLVTQRERLWDDQNRLFHPITAYLRIRDVPVGEDSFRDDVFQDLESLKEHLDKPLESDQEDPRSRHIFVSAGSSRSPLYCSGSMFRYLCSYHQVSPNFLKLVHSLGDQIEYNKKFHAVGFFDEILFKTSPGRSLGVPGLGRSGSEYRTYYQLQAMEYSPESGNNWVIRQTTVYYSFDLETARCFWITVKGGPGLRTRIQDQNKTQHDVQPEALQDLCGAFQASLATHLTHLEWCTEGWRWAIDHKEARIRGALDRVGAAPIKQEKTREFVRFVSFTPDSKNQGSERMTFEGGISRPSSWRTFLTKDERHEYQHVVKEADNAFRQCKTQEQNIIRQGRILDGFSILEFQDLTSDTMILQEVKLAMTLNIDVLRGIRDSYQSFLKSPECPKKIRNKCQGIIRHFQRRIKSLERELSIECRRADTLISQLQEAKPLYDLILQYRNAEMNKFLAFNAHYASVRMESVGERTERLTSSMHIITLFTLLLLPGTFLGSFFSTEIIKGGDGKGVSWDAELGVLFAKLCAPMMAATMAVWVLYMWYNRWVRTRRRPGSLIGGEVV